MDYFIEICAIITFIEQRIKQKLDFTELEKILNFSYRHIRGIFKIRTNMSLSRYIMIRKIANCALEIVSTPKSLTTIAFEYGFDHYDTFTRAFKRETGIRPSEFKKSGLVCGRKHICLGVYAPAILNLNQESVLQNLSEVDFVSKTFKTQDSCILYGVPKVYYGRNVDGGWQGTPFPMCLQAVLNYMGQNVHYSYIMAASGASFRLRWNVNGWDLSAVDIRNIYEKPLMPFELAFKAVGRKFKILNKDSNSYSKKDFINLIKLEIDEGRPVIALGVVGPPEASIITGYKDNCETVLGWSLFQDNMEFSENITFDESGYFICNNWWENTEAVMSIGEEISVMSSMKELLENAYYLLTTDTIQVEKRSTYFGGQKAYSAWASAMEDDLNFSKQTPLSLQIEHMMCFGDAVTMVGEGRSYAAGYINWIGETNPEVSNECRNCAGYLNAVADCVTKMSNILGGFGGEDAVQKITDKEIRMQIVSLIKLAQRNEAKACDELKTLISKV
ncbi:helix-turn-helix domain-containing protein [Ruminiclostridium josui]|uniref:helix-turn-helix domain-containing protein n=1 Tax=Ruminiclostridium josui TaxID=1499 RepID=UPI0004664A3C|nr:helix-turn-helix transcriptional regulator [Ruminiclostridium josui]